MSYNFSKNYRILSFWEYKSIRKMGCKLHTPHFILYIYNNSHHTARLGLTISRKVGNSVVRNRLKRYLREYFRLSNKNYKSNIDISIIAKNGASDLLFSEVCSEIGNVLEVKGFLDV